jgi:filamentous hemagglutinin
MSLAEYLDSPKGQKASGATGGIQGWKGTLFGISYPPGSVIDKAIESFGGSHDFIGGTLTGLYDEQGKATRGMSGTEKILYEAWSDAGAIIVSAPFAMPELLPPGVWKGIAIFSGTATGITASRASSRKSFIFLLARIDLNEGSSLRLALFFWSEDGHGEA